MGNSVILRIKGASFNNPALPMVIPFMFNGFVARGLLYAVRPAGGEASLVDLAGNGVVASVVGAPVWKDTGVLVNTSNHLATSVKEPLDLTIAVVWRPAKNSDGSYSSCMTGSFFGELSGVSIYSSPTVDAENGALMREIGVAQCYAADNPSGDNPANANTGAPPNAAAYNTYLANAPDDDIPWEMSILAVNTAKNMARVYVPRIGYSGNITAAPGKSFAYRNRSTNVFLIGTANNGFGTGKAEIAECALWNRALTPEEVASQFLQTKSTLQAKGVFI